MTKCKKHPRYKAKTAPSIVRRCDHCWAAWLTSGNASVTLRPKFVPAVVNIKVLEAAEKRCPGNEFVQSVREHFTRKGFISQKQADCLANTQPGRYTGGYSSDQYDEDYDEDGLTESDLC